MFISMETFPVSIPMSSYTVSFITPKPSFQFTSNKSYTFRKTHFNFPLRYRNRFHISAQFARRSSRQNSLRKKLTDNLQVRPKNPQIPAFENNDDTDTQSNLSAIESSSVRERDEVVVESVLWNKLEGWIEQYKKDIEFWGLGSSPIFVVHQDSQGNVKRVLVDEDEIVKRRPSEESGEVSLKISHARFLAKEIERGNYMLPKSSSVVKFVSIADNSRRVSGIRSSLMRFDFVPDVSRFGIVPLCGLLLVWAVRKFLSKGGGENELTRLEKEMLRRKMESRKKETFKDGIIEVVPEIVVPATEFVERPHLDKEELMNSIRIAMQSSNQMEVSDEIRDMAMHAREVEKHEHSPNEPPVIEIETMDEHLDTPNCPESESSTKAEDTDSVVEKETRESMNTYFAEVSGDMVPGDNGDQLLPTRSTSVNIPSKVDKGNQIERRDGQGNLQELGTNDAVNPLGQSTNSKQATRKKPRVIRSVAEAREYLSDKQNPQFRNEDRLHESSNVFSEGEDTGITSDHTSERLGEEYTVTDSSDLYSPLNTIPSIKSSNALYGKSSNTPPSINGLNGKAPNISVSTAGAHDSAKDEEPNVDTKKKVGKEKKISSILVPDRSVSASESVVSKEDSQDSSLKEEDCLRPEISGVNMDVHSTTIHNSSCHEDADLNSSQCSDDKKPMSDIVKPTGLGEYETASAVSAFDDDSCLRDIQSQTAELNNHDVSDEKHPVDQVFTAETPKAWEEYEEEIKIEASTVKNNWLEKNFDELLPVLEKMSSGFTKNYVAAREKVKLELDQGSELTQLKAALNDNTELEWMNDDKLRDIVFKVRDNEIAGRDPFHSMDDEDKITFFKGLEEKVEKESNKLSGFHEWLHSNIENLDYGADGISVYDPPEKIIPRWKGAPFDKIREFLESTPEAPGDSPDKATDLPVHQNLNLKLEVPSNNAKPVIKVPKTSKTLIESSDGSVKPGKRNGNEHWQHTKKHTRGFLESYNAEGDPEIKEVMRDMGKDLDRWITEEEIKKAANHMGKVPRRSKAFVEKKLSKIKSEVEQFGTQAVLSKYREYAVAEEEDYLWWLDLPYVLCLELYTQEGDEMKVGFYTLEMAADLELDPKPYHVIAFEEPGECKNLCYIMQSHFEMLGKDGKAFVVAQPPKEAFRDAKSNGFGVTVIRKGELALNVDQPLEEVEELITEIGSKMYHDKIMKERSVDMRSVMKGVIATSKPAKRKNVKRRRLKKPKN